MNMENDNLLLTFTENVNCYQISYFNFIILIYLHFNIMLNLVENKYIFLISYFKCFSEELTVVKITIILI